jgi:hypothetical protein
VRPDPPRFRWSEAGTRFLVYPQDRVVPGFEMPRIARVTPRPGAIKAGPEDTRIRVVDAIRKKPYRDPVTAEYLWRPPYPKGMPREPRVRPGPRGEFDYVKPGTREFSAATAYASVRCVLEIWEHYLGRRISLVGKGQRKLEIVPRVAAVGDNAWSGEWYIELGFAGRNPRQPYCENLDVIAHEMGHIILKHVIGPTPTGRLEFERRAHDEAGADLVSLVTILHFDRVVDAVLAQTKGKLFSKNIVSRIGEYRADGTGRRRAGRFFFQNQTMRKVASARRSGNKTSTPGRCWARRSTSWSRSTRRASPAVGSSAGILRSARLARPLGGIRSFAASSRQRSRRIPTASPTRSGAPPPTSRGSSRRRGEWPAAPGSRSHGSPRTSSRPTRG